MAVDVYRHLSFFSSLVFRRILFLPRGMRGQVFLLHLLSLSIPASSAFRSLFLFPVQRELSSLRTPSGWLLPRSWEKKVSDLPLCGGSVLVLASGEDSAGKVVRSEEEDECRRKKGHFIIVILLPLLRHKQASKEFFVGDSLHVCVCGSGGRLL